MRFEVASILNNCTNKNTIYLVSDKWDDWFTYSTLFKVRYVDKDGKTHKLGSVKIGQHGQGRSPDLPEEFEQLSDEFFSLGTSEDYYLAIKETFYAEKIREEICIALNDIAFNLQLFDDVRVLDVVQTSLMRDFTTSMVKNQFHRLTIGGAWLTTYCFSYVLHPEESEEDRLKLDFEVEPTDMPPSNIHVLIGKNGVGKTSLLKNMVNSLESDREDYGKIETWGSRNFANVVYVSFSAFDKYLEVEDDIIPYLYIGLAKENGMKDLNELAKDFAGSLFEISHGYRKKLWYDTISILESDNTFIELDIKSWSVFSEYDEDKRKEKFKENDDEIKGKGMGAYRKAFLKKEFVKKIIPQFNDLSSGHKVILLIVARLIELVEEKTLVIMDEPEEHLHPPLVSALIRALSNLLTYRNGVGIIATHSPVIAQEVPKKCVWILRRTGDELIAERPQSETFGENIGILTSEIFGYEVTASGFHAIIQEAVKKKTTYKSALRYFNSELGNEGKIG